MKGLFVAISVAALCLFAISVDAVPRMPPIGTVDAFTYRTPAVASVNNVLFINIDDMAAVQTDHCEADNDDAGELCSSDATCRAAGGAEGTGTCSPYYPDLETPNIDRLAAGGVSFTNAHAPSAMCNPSRTAMLMGVAPETSGITSGSSSQFDWRETSTVYPPSVVPYLEGRISWIRHFKDNGYRVVGAGKLFQDQLGFTADDYDAGTNPNGTQWDEYTLRIAGVNAATPNDGTTYDDRGDSAIPGDVQHPGGVSGLVDGTFATEYGGGGYRPAADFGYFEWNDGSPWSTDRTTETPDHERASWAVDQIKSSYEENIPAGSPAGGYTKPILAMVGLYRPHIPHYCPAAFWNGTGVAAAAGYDGIPADPKFPPYLAGDTTDIPHPAGSVLWDEEFKDAGLTLRGNDFHYVRERYRAYLACVEFIDYEIGRMLDAVDASTEDWTVVLWSDNGFHIREKDRWEKFTLWQRASLVTLVMSGPDFPNGLVVDEATTLVDVFPTVAEVIGVTLLPGQEGQIMSNFWNDNPPPQTAVARTEYTDYTNELDTFIAYKSKYYSYIINENEGTTEFYDLTVDPNEWDNLESAANGGPDNPAYTDERNYLTGNYYPRPAFALPTGGCTLPFVLPCTDL